MYPASSRHHDRRPRSARTPARRRPDLRPLLEALDNRQLLSGVVSNIDNAPIVQITGEPLYMYNESYNNSGNIPPKAIDGDVNTSWDNAAPNSFIGYNLGRERVARLTSVSVYPSPGTAASMVGGRFEASDDGAHWDVLGSITSAPAQGQFTSIPLYDPAHFYKNFRYVAPSAGYGTVAEIKFFGNLASNPPLAPTNFTYTAGPDSLTVLWDDNAINATNYNVSLSTAPHGGTVVGGQILGGDATSATFTNLTPGTYYFHVGAGYTQGATIGPIYTTNMPLVGTPIGTAGSWGNSGNTFDKAFDGDTNTYFDAPTSPAYVGYDFGTPTTVASVSYVPRVGHESRMVGGQIRGSNDGVNWTSLATITTTPWSNGTNKLAIANPAPYRYIQYLSPQDGYGNVAELNFYGPRPSVTETAPAAPGGATATNNGPSIIVGWADDATNEFGYVVELYDNPAHTGAPVAYRTVTSNVTRASFQISEHGTYYATVRAVNNAGSSAPVSAAPVTYNGEPAYPINLFYSAGPSSLTFTWHASSGDETGYVAELSLARDFSTLVGSQTLPAYTHTATFTGLAPDTYFFRVRATNAAGSSQYTYLTAILSAPSVQLVGRPIGTPGSWNNEGNDLTKAFDSDTTTFFDAPTSQAYVGYDFGAPVTLTAVSLYPRRGQESRMVGGQFQASNDGTNWTTLATVQAAPSGYAYTTLEFHAAPATYRYVRYLAPDGGYGNVAELQFYGNGTPVLSPTAPTNVAATSDRTAGSVRVTWGDAATDETGYEAEISTTPDFSAGFRTQTVGANATQALFTSVNPGTYYVRVRALGSLQNSAWTTAASPVTLAPPVTGNQLTGTPIGTPGSWSDSGNDLTKAFDGDTTTFFDAPIGDAWVGLDLGFAQPLDHVRFFPRAGLAWRMVDGTFQGSNDGATWTTLATISSEPAEGTYTSMPLGGGSYRYVRYQGAAWGSGNVAELQFYTTGEPVPTTPAAPNSATGYTTPSIHLLSFAWRDNATNETGYQYQLSSTPDFSHVLRSGALAPNTRGVDLYDTADGTYYFRLRALSSDGTASAWAAAAPINVDNVAVQLTGTPIGTAGSWNDSGNDITKVFDNATSSYFDAPTSQAYVGLDFGHQVTVTQVDYYARVAQESRMVGGQFRVSDDGVNWTTIHTVTEVPLPNVPYTFAVPNPGAYRYLSYLSPLGGYGNIAEMRAYGIDAPVSTRVPGTRIGTAGSWNNSGNTFDKAFDNDLSTFFDAPTSPSFAGLDFGKPVVVTSVIYAPRAGYESRMVGGQIRASDDGVHWVTLATINSAPKAGEYSVINIASPAAHRYVEYLSPDGGFGNVAELQFLGYVA